MTQAASMRDQGEGVYALAGSLTFAEVGALLPQFAAALAEPPHTKVFDLAAVEGADTAGLALLLEGMDMAADQDCGIRFRNLPEELLSLARISNLLELLPLD